MAEAVLSAISTRGVVDIDAFSTVLEYLVVTARLERLP